MPRLGDDAGAAGFSLVTLETVDSTNRLALDLAEQAGANKTWVISQTQRAGRGRHGRNWASPPGNLYASLLLVAPCAPADAPKLGFVAGLAVAETLRSIGLTDACIKWPNDIVVGGAKLAGLLLEGRLIKSNRQTIAIGIGINVVSAPVLAEGRAVSLADLGLTFDRRDVFRRLSNRFTHWYTIFDRGAGFADIRRAWSEHALAEGTAITVKLPSGMREGRFLGIDEHGRLQLDAGGSVTLVDAGDVFVSEEDNG